MNRTMALLVKLLALLSTTQFEFCWATQFPGVVTSASGQMGSKATVHRDGAMLKLLFLGGKGRGYFRLL